IDVTPGSRLLRAFAGQKVMVNSMHHQGIRRLGTGLRATAIAPDGLIEALESEDESHFIVGVQWHPEMLIDTDPGTRRLFEDFIEASLQYSRAAALV
ncbi:MAG TPA: gamma-glutamyl-gamma-aminobutyrate hydrolase family protein, partial [Longimicrobium sp.]